MREIKFRGWSNGQMTYSEPMPDFSFWKWASYDSNTILMQACGLKDKNGKEIYEGDVLQYFYGQRGVVEFIHGAFRAKFGGVLNPYLHTWVEDKELPRLEVIGNIYENPELLTNNN